MSKGNTSRRDQLSSSNLRESAALPFSSAPPNDPTFEDSNAYVSNEKSRFGWSKQTEKEAFNVERVPSGRTEGSFSASAYPDYQKSRPNPNGAAYDYDEQIYEENKPPLVNIRKLETFEKPVVEEKRRIGAQVKYKNPLEFDTYDSGPDEDLLSLLMVINHF